MKDLLTSRKFWSALLMLAVIVISAVVPSFDMDVEHAAGLVVIVVAYLVGVAVDPGLGWRGIFGSRKFWAALIGFVVMVLDGFHVVIPFALSTEQLISIAVVIGGYISGVALEKPRV